MRRTLAYAKLLGWSLVGRARKRLVGINTVALITRTENRLFATDPEGMGVGKVLRKTGAYGQGELRRVFAYIGNCDNVLVVGAHIGSLAIPIAKRCRTVVAIEPNPNTFMLLKINLQLNNAENVRAYDFAASDTTGRIEFISNTSNSGGAKRMPKVRANEYFYDLPKTIEVQAYALDEQLGGEEFSLVLMDIEGSEYFALKGMQDILRNANALFVEYWPHHLRNVSGVSPKEFLSVIAPHFESLLIPSKNLQIKKAEFLPALQAMFDQNQGDEGVIFIK